MIKKYSWCNVDSGLLVLRIGVAIVFIVSGWMKLSNLDMTVESFAGIGLNAFWAYLVTIVEFLGGIAVLLGIYTRISAKLLAIIMLVAIVITFKGITSVFTPLILFFSTLALFLAGGGKYTIISKMCGCGTCVVCKDNDINL